MSRMTLLATAAVMSSLIAAPALAQGMKADGPSTRAQKSQTVQTKKISKADRPSARREARADRTQARSDRTARRDRMSADDGYGTNDRYGNNNRYAYTDRSGYDRDQFWPGAVVAGAAATAATVATAPFRDDAYAYDTTYDRPYVAQTYVNRPYDSYASYDGGRTNSWAWDNSWDRSWNNDWNNQSYARSNVVCRSGSVYTDGNGFQQVCP